LNHERYESQIEKIAKGGSLIGLGQDTLENVMKNLYKYVSITFYLKLYMYFEIIEFKIK
jgi:hypothetical protein